MSLPDLYSPLVISALRLVAGGYITPYQHNPPTSWTDLLVVKLHCGSCKKGRKTHGRMHGKGEKKLLILWFRRNRFLINNGSACLLLPPFLWLKPESAFSLCNYLSSSVVTLCVSMTHPQSPKFFLACSFH